MAAKKEEYLCLSAMLRAREPKMLTYSKAVAMTEADSFENAAKQMADCGFPDMSGMNAAEIISALSDYRNEIFGELRRLSPDGELVDVFCIKYDYHNAKTLVKAIARGADPKPLFSGAGRYEPERLLSDYLEDTLQDYNEVFTAALKNAREVLALSGNPQESDAVLDKAYFAELTAMADNLEIDFLSQYAAALADSANLRTAARFFRMGKSPELLGDMLVPGGAVKEEKLESIDNPSALHELFATGPMAPAAALVEDAVEGGSLTEFEKACDDAVTALIKKARYVTYGPETVIAYLSATEAEITAARMILTGRLSGVDGAVIRERLRDMYA